jgi:hypothetical protein
MLDLPSLRINAGFLKRRSELRSINLSWKLWMVIKESEHW